MQGNWNESHRVKNSRAERMEWADKKGRIDMMDNEIGANSILWKILWVVNTTWITIM